MNEFESKEIVTNKSGSLHQEPKKPLAIREILSSKQNSQNSTNNQSQNTSACQSNDSYEMPIKRAIDAANLNPAKRAGANLSAGKKENNSAHLLGGIPLSQSSLSDNGNFTDLYISSTTQATFTDLTSAVPSNNLSTLTTLFQLPSNSFTLGSTLTRSAFLFGSSQTKPEAAVNNVAMPEIKPQAITTLDSIIKCKSFDTGKPQAKKTFCRFDNLTTYQDEKFDYSANTIPDMPFHVGEGPMRSEEIIRFFNNVLFNPKLASNPVVCIVAAGHPGQGNKYFAYFLQEHGITFEERDDFLDEKDYEYYESHKNDDDENSDNDDNDSNDNSEYNIGRLELISTKITERAEGNIVYYKVRATLNKTQTKEITVLNLPKFAEFSNSPLTQHDIREFLNLYQVCKKNNTSFFIHCAAGRGRSCTLALAFILFEHHDECYGPNGTPKYTAIAQKMRELRDIRPGAVQTVEQLQMAIDMGHELKKVYDLDLQAQKDQSRDYKAPFGNP